MWLMKIKLPDEECPLVYTASDTAAQILYETFKSHWPDALYTVISYISGQDYVPHDGTKHPYWMTESGLVDDLHQPTWIDLKKAMKDDFQKQIEMEGWTQGHSSEPEDPPEDLKYLSFL